MEGARSIAVVGGVAVVPVVMHSFIAVAVFVIAPVILMRRDPRNSTCRESAPLPT